MASTVQFAETTEIREVVVEPPTDDVAQPVSQELEATVAAGSFDDSDSDDDEVGDLSVNGFARKVNLNYTVSSYRGSSSSK
jgi:hypothetical protein